MGLVVAVVGVMAAVVRQRMYEGLVRDYLTCIGHAVCEVEVSVAGGYTLG